jgi:hypothetical protein
LLLEICILSRLRDAGTRDVIYPEELGKKVYSGGSSDDLAVDHGVQLTYSPHDFAFRLYQTPVLLATIVLQAGFRELVFLLMLCTSLLSHAKQRCKPLVQELEMMYVCVSSVMLYSVRDDAWGHYFLGRPINRSFDSFQLLPLGFSILISRNELMRTNMNL